MCGFCLDGPSGLPVCKVLDGRGNKGSRLGAAVPLGVCHPGVTAGEPCASGSMSGVVLLGTDRVVLGVERALPRGRPEIASWVSSLKEVSMPSALTVAGAGADTEPLVAAG